ncbi:MAG: hypothetical protein O3A46_16320, partial [Candidatus Poribacteria bacterium]|nr:hypothetical protein [Candidatus Poribacteria bacterium]
PMALRPQVRAVVTLATPHYGTPLADFFDALGLENLLGFAGGLGSKWSTEERIRNAAIYLEKRHDKIERVVPETFRGEFTRLVEAFAAATADEVEGVQTYLSSLRDRRGALRRLRVKAMRRFNRKVTDAPDVRYLSYVTGIEPPKSREFGVALFSLSAFLATGWWSRNDLPPYPNDGIVPPDKIIPIDGKALPDDAAPIKLSRKLSDGVVPSASQFWGEFGGYVAIDHHSVIGLMERLPQPAFHEFGRDAFYARIAATLLNA